MKALRPLGLGVLHVLLAALALTACLPGTPPPVPQTSTSAAVGAATRTAGPQVTTAPGPTSSPPARSTSTAVALSAPTISLSPTSGGPGTHVTIACSGFAARAVISLRIAPPNTSGTWPSFGTVATDDQGKVNIAFIIPEQWPAGMPPVEKELAFAVVDTVSGAQATAVFSFQPRVVVQPALPTPTRIASGEPTAYVSANWVNLRSGPGSGYSLLIRLEQGQVLSLMGRTADAGWVQVKLVSGQQGWVPISSIEASQPISSLAVVARPGGSSTPDVSDYDTNAYLTNKWANLRSGPDSSYSYILRIEQEQDMTLLGRNLAGSWVQVRLPSGEQGWLPVGYIEANMPIGRLPVTTGFVPTPTPGDTGVEPMAYASSGPLELRSGPGSDNAVIIVTAISRDTGMGLLGRNAEATWVQVRLPDGYVGWVAAGSVQTNLPVKDIPVTAGPKPALTLNTYSARSGTSIRVSVAGFLAYQDIAVTLMPPAGSGGLMMARGRTDVKGGTQFTFTMPGLWSDGRPIDGGGIVLAVSSLDGSVAVNTDLQFLP